MATAIQCQEYENHLKSEAVAIKEAILVLQRKYEKKIEEVIKLRRGELKSRKNLASSYTCDAQTGTWRLTREATFECTAPDLEDFSAAVEENEETGFVSKVQDTISHSPFSHVAFESSNLINEPEEPEEPKCQGGHVSPIDIKSAEAEQAEGVYVNNMDLIDEFLSDAVVNKNFTGFLAKAEKHSDSDSYTPLMYKFDQPIKYNQHSLDIKCDHLNFHLRGSEHSVDGQLFDGEVQLYCWMASEAETFDEAVDLSRTGDSSIVQVFSYFLKQGTSDTTYNNLLSAVLSGGSQLIERTEDSGNSPQSIHQQKIQLETDLPVLRDYYGYEGSMTSSGCDSNVHWTIFKQPIDINPKQFSVITTDLWANSGFLSASIPIENSSNRIVRRYQR